MNEALINVILGIIVFCLVMVILFGGKQIPRLLGGNLQAYWNRYAQHIRNISTRANDIQRLQAEWDNMDNRGYQIAQAAFNNAHNQGLSDQQANQQAQQAYDNFINVRRPQIIAAIHNNLGHLQRDLINEVNGATNEIYGALTNDRNDPGLGQFIQAALNAARQLNNQWGNQVAAYITNYNVPRFNIG